MADPNADQVVVTVRGEARLEVEPEIAVLSVMVAAKDRIRHRAIEALTKRTREVGDQIRSYGDAVERLESRPVSVRPIYAQNKARKEVISHFAQAGFAVTLSDFAVLGAMVAALADLDLVTLGGPIWQLRPDSPVYRQARLAAVKESLVRARDYATAFGGRITGLAEAADIGLLGGGDSRHPVMASAFSRTAADMAQDALEIDLEPEIQTAYAQIEARFTMTKPDLGP